MDRIPRGLSAESAVAVMASGSCASTHVGIIGALASILASLLVGGSSSEEEEEVPAAAPALSIQEELKTVREELAVMRLMIEKMSSK